jgi:hypothetical protein
VPSCHGGSNSPRSASGTQLARGLKHQTADEQGSGCFSRSVNPAGNRHSTQDRRAAWALERRHDVRFERATPLDALDVPGQDAIAALTASL